MFFFHFFFQNNSFFCCHFIFFYFNQRNRLSIFLILLTVFSLKRGGSFFSLTNFLTTSVQIFFPLKSNIDIYHMISKTIFPVGKHLCVISMIKHKNQLNWQQMLIVQKFNPYRSWIDLQTIRLSKEPKKSRKYTLITLVAKEYSLRNKKHPEMFEKIIKIVYFFLTFKIA